MQINHDLCYYKIMFKVSTFGKLLMASTVVEVASKMLDNRQAAQDAADKFSENEIRALAAAVQAGDYMQFQKLYTFRRSWANADNVSKAYDVFCRSL